MHALEGLSAVTAEIARLEEPLSAEQVRTLRAAAGLPAVDGAPLPWLQRYRDLLVSRAKAPTPARSELDEWWAEQTQRRPKTYQVWIGRGAKPRQLLSTTDDRSEAERIARAQDETCWVLPGTPARRPTPKLSGVKGLRSGEEIAADKEPVYLLRVSGKSKRGPWARPIELPKGWVALQERAKAMATAADGTRVRALGMGPDAARSLVPMLAAGVLRWRKRTAKVQRVALRLERDEADARNLVVRRSA